MELYHVSEDDLQRIPETSVDYERTLEKQLVRTHAATIGGEDLLYLSRQEGPSDDQTTFDLIAVDANGDIVILELKRDRTPRDIISQALDYASGLRNTTYETLADWYEEFRQAHDIETPTPSALNEAHADYFELDEPLSEREFNQDQRLLLLADEFDEKTISVADFLREHGIDVICVTHQSFRSEEGLHLLTTEAIRRPLREEPQSMGEDGSRDGPTTRKAEQQLAFWKRVKEEIASRNSPLNNGWTPKNNTACNLKTVAGAPIQGGCKVNEQVVEMRFIIKDDAELYRTLNESQEEIEDRISTALSTTTLAEYQSEWIAPTETTATKDRGKFIVRRSIDFDDEKKLMEGVQWLVEVGDVFFEVFSEEIESE
ncbi:hypothetical protein AUR64_04020 [Haloprofundus marisrubri]|uniref:DUF4268 domain-containing protein n=1 Tax=Haloprofundus marisrubri TaxID=1514971 RepID=A0A0W1RCJ6_9EURY|nr:hypothetical protein [Haloprofundus marisrubri]KTG11429.1 hypothetical protein AUR64_04020 [Haloprofundus marisrubri]